MKTWRLETYNLIKEEENLNIRGLKWEMEFLVESLFLQSLRKSIMKLRELFLTLLSDL